ncbi:TPA: hypothetical protein N0F65_004058 [Lagenidium giganteum]|uniref:Uncharacterized protein n=1 Tax=Lagenidium giganteum TaxID=4803 RepID=A0AAV2YWT9_9STRA|nr:TPA: hypothetical protein N0F65_004058 [Lagenidium giganteum]
MWDKEADDYWKEMEPTRRRKQAIKYVGIAVGLALVGGATWTASGILPTLGRVSPLAPVDVTQLNATPTAAPAVANEAASARVVVDDIKRNYALESNPSAVDVLRARCRVRGVQTKWHEENCRRHCVRESNAACMNGCSYGSITATKLACDQLPIHEVPTAKGCPDGVQCVTACRVYETEKPYPEAKNACERACAHAQADACARALQIFRDLYQGTPV